MAICRFAADAVRHELTPVDNSFITDHLPDASALQLKVYLYGLMQCHYPSMAARPLTEALGISEQAACEAFLYWQQQGLVRILSDVPLQVEFRDPLSSCAKSTGSGKYAALVGRINALTAPRQFGMQELKHVYDWVEVYGLEEGAVLELIAHCMELRGRRVSINYMSSVAQSWAERGICTFEDARKSIESYDLKNHGATAVLRAWNKRRKPTADEMALYEKWTGEWGFSDAAVLAALPRLTVTGSPNFAYLDELLDRMRSQNLTSEETIGQDDRQSDADRDFAKLLFARAGKVEPATRTQRAQISMYRTDYGMEDAVLFYAADLSRGANEPFGKMKRLLEDWHQKGVTTIDAAKAFEASRIAAQAKKPMRRGTKYDQHGISEEDLSHLLLDLNEDMFDE